MRASSEGSESPVCPSPVSVVAFRLALLLHRASARVRLKSCRVFLSLPDDGPCLGSRKPKQPYEWLSYSEVRAAKKWKIIHL